MDSTITPVLLFLDENMKIQGEGSVLEQEETPAIPQDMERAGSTGITPQIRRGNGRRTKYNFDDEDRGEVDYYKDKDLGVPYCQWMIV